MVSSLYSELGDLVPAEGLKNRPASMGLTTSGFLAYPGECLIHVFLLISSY